MRTAIWSFCALLLLAAVTAAADSPSNTSSMPLYVSNHAVHSLAKGGDTLYAGGDFDSIAYFTGSGALLDPETFLPKAGFPVITGGYRYVHASISDGQGGWFIGGEFTKAGLITRNRLVHIRANGSVNELWDPQPNDIVRRLALSPDRSILYVGGAFTSIGGQPRERIAALDAATGAVLNWNPGASHDVYAILPTESVVYVGGQFTSIGGQSRQYIAALDPVSGLATAWNAGADATVRCLARGGSKLYVGGSFKNIGGKQRWGLAEIESATGLATDWDLSRIRWVPDFMSSSTYPATIYNIIVNQSELFVVGDFNAWFGSWNIISKTYTKWTDTTFGDVYGRSWGFASLAITESKVYAGGYGSPYLVVLDRQTNRQISTPKLTDGPVYTIAANSTGVFFGGTFKTASIQPRANLAAFDLKTDRLRDWAPTITGGTVSALAASESTLYVGGSFTAVNGEARNGLAAFDLATGALKNWNPSVNGTEWNPSANGTVRKLIVSGSTIFASGDFIQVDGQTRRGIAALDADSGLISSWDANNDGGISDIVLHGSLIYICGSFSTIGGRNIAKVAALDVATGRAIDWSIDIDQIMFRLAVNENRLFLVTGIRVYGNFQYSLRSVDPTTGKVTDWTHLLPSKSVIYAMWLHGSTLLIGGGNIGEVPLGVNRDLGALDTQTGATIDWQPLNMAGNHGLFEMIVDGGNVYVAGSGREIARYELCDLRFEEAGLTGAGAGWPKRQLVAKGAKSTPIHALAPYEYGFSHWTMGGKTYSTANPLIIDNVTGPLTLTAHFARRNSAANWLLYH